MGTVYEAQEVSSGRRVALKLISGSFAASQASVERFRQEGRLTSLVTHPRCVFVLAANEEAGRPYIVMELMGGETLQELVSRHGPLPVEQAIAKILDVIDGLRAAHQLGVIHRDVKPSNCFLEADGRVKIGDFGLSKSLQGDTHLTRTGVFLGTPLYASPEQVRGEGVDRQSDVYSVAATLYFLLTGQAPFQSGDAAVTLARIAADPVPPLRSLRPELPAALDQVVRRGLERDRQRRYRDLDEFRQALLPFVPGQLSAAGLGLRFAAYLLDTLVLTPLWLPALLVDMGGRDRLQQVRAAFWGLLAGMLAMLAYYTILEGKWGWSVGKRWLRLRVWTTRSPQPPGVGRALVRSGIWLGLTNFSSLAVFLVIDPTKEVYGPSYSFLAAGIQLGGLVAGLLLMVSTMRAHNGYRGLHEVLSGTRVILLPEPPRRRSGTRRALDQGLQRHAALPERLGPYVVRGAFREGPSGTILLGEEESLGRAVLIELRRPGAAGPEAARRELTRPTRLRWLAGGHFQARRWDAYLAPTGRALPDLLTDGGRLAWAEVQPILEQLIEEFNAGTADGTLPPRLGLDQVWLQPDGQVQLLDAPLGGEDPSVTATPTSSAKPVAHEVAAFEFLRQLVIWTLEGHPRPVDQPTTIRAPLPADVAALLNRLLGTGAPFEGLRQLQGTLRGMANRPTHVTPARRLVHLAWLSLFLYIGLSYNFSLSFAYLPDEANALSGHIQKEQALLTALNTLDSTGCWLHPQPLARLAAVAQLQADRDLRDQLTTALDTDQRRRNALLESRSCWSRKILTTMELQRQKQQEKKDRMTISDGQTIRADADYYRTHPFPAASPWVFSRLVCLWPAAWVLWAFLTRGGLSYRLAALRLVRADGHPASRLQCAGRALLVWFPFVALQAGSVWLDTWWFAAWNPGGSPEWALWLSWVLWYLAVLLLPAYVVLALRQPARSWHDRLAGTYLVPR
jgi:hypothetical protein